MSNIWLNYGGKGLKFGSGIKVAYENTPPAPQNMMYYDLGSETISGQVEKTIDLRSAGLPSSSPDRPVVVFYFDVQLITPTNGLINTFDVHLVVPGASENNYLLIGYGKVFSTINFYIEAAAFTSDTFPRQQPTSNSFKLKIIYNDDLPDYVPQFKYQLWTNNMPAPTSPFVRTPVEGVKPSPYDVTAISSRRGGVSGNITLSNLRCAGFTNLADAVAWTGESF